MNSGEQGRPGMHLSLVCVKGGSGNKHLNIQESSEQLKSQTEHERRKEGSDEAVKAIKEMGLS